jgi:hypothetical protein
MELYRFHWFDEIWRFNEEVAYHDCQILAVEAGCTGVPSFSARKDERGFWLAELNLGKNELGIGRASPDEYTLKTPCGARLTGVDGGSLTFSEVTQEILFNYLWVQGMERCDAERERRRTDALHKKHRKS